MAIEKNGLSYSKHYPICHAFLHLHNFPIIQIRTKQMNVDKRELLEQRKLKDEYQKWMKMRPRLKALDIYAAGWDSRKGSPSKICRIINHIAEKISILTGLASA